MADFKQLFQLVFGLCSFSQGYGQAIEPNPVARVLYGDRLQLTCHLGTDWDSMVWDREGFGWALTAFRTSCGLNKTRIGYFITCNGDSVTLHKVNPEDGHTYKCLKNKGSIRTESQSTRVEVYIDGPYLDTNHKNMSVRESDKAELVCMARGGPNITVTWTRVNSTEVLPSVQTSQGAILTINKVSRDQTGNYTCHGSFNYQGKSYHNQTQLELNVLYAPSVTILGGGTYKNGTTPTLQCITDGYPPAEHVVWTHYIDSVLVRQLKGSIVQEGNKLELPEVQFKDSGTYVCAASNSVMGDDQVEQTNSTAVVVQHSPIWLDENFTSDYFGEKNSQVQLTFRYFANPEVYHLVLIPENTNISLKNDDNISIQYGKNPELFTIYGKQIKKEIYTVVVKFSPILEPDSGQYTLKIANEISSAERSFNIHALDKPTLPEDVHVEVISSVVIKLHWSYKYEVNDFLSFLIMCQNKRDGLSWGEESPSFYKTQREYTYTKSNLRPDTLYSFKICAENPLGKHCTTTFLGRTKSIINDKVALEQISTMKEEDTNNNGTVTIIAISVSAGVILLICILIFTKINRRRKRASQKFRGSGSYEGDDLRSSGQRAIANSYEEKPRLPARGILSEFGKTEYETIDSAISTLYEQIPADLKVHDRRTCNIYTRMKSTKENKKGTNHVLTKGSPTSVHLHRKSFGDLQNEYSSIILKPEKLPVPESGTVVPKLLTPPAEESNLAQEKIECPVLKDLGQNNSKQDTNEMDKNAYMTMAENNNKEGPINRQLNSVTDVERTDLLEKCGYIAMNKVAGEQSQESSKENTGNEA